MLRAPIVTQRVTFVLPLRLSNIAPDPSELVFLWTWPPITIPRTYTSHMFSIPMASSLAGSTTDLPTLIRHLGRMLLSSQVAKECCVPIFTAEVSPGGPAQKGISRAGPEPCSSRLPNARSVTEEASQGPTPQPRHGALYRRDPTLIRISHRILRQGRHVQVT